MKKNALFFVVAAATCVLLTGCPNDNKPTGEKISSMSFSETAITMTHSESHSLTLQTGDASQEGIVYTSSADSVATVDEYGTVTATSYVAIEGTTTITATAPGEMTTTGEPMTATCEVTLTNEMRLVDFYGWYPSGSYNPQPGTERWLRTITEGGDTILRQCFLGKCSILLFDGTSGMSWVDQASGRINITFVPGDFYCESDFYPLLLSEDQNGDGVLDTVFLLSDTLNIVESVPAQLDSTYPGFVMLGGDFDVEAAEDIVAQGGQLDNSVFIGTWIRRSVDNAGGYYPLQGAYIEPEGYFLTTGDPAGKDGIVWGVAGYNYRAHPCYTVENEDGSYSFSTPYFSFEKPFGGEVTIEGPIYEDQVTEAPAVNAVPAELPVIRNVRYVPVEEIRYNNRIMRTLKYVQFMNIAK